MKGLENMSQVNLIDSKTKITTYELRREIARLIKQANAVNFEMGDSKLNTQNRNYFLRDFRVSTRSGGFVSNINYYHRGKRDLISLHNQLAQYINADTQSKTHRAYMDKREKQIVKKFKATMKKEYGITITDRDIAEYVELKEMYPELFESDFEFYKNLLEILSTDKKDERSVMQVLSDLKVELQQKARDNPDDPDSDFTDTKLRVAFLEHYGIDYQ